jgi:predicted dithiol-disulfide oxidoreductase (DUF899 family)
MKTIHHVVDMEAPARKVWSALTEEDQMAGWWSTQVTAPSASVGTQVHWTFAGDFNPVMEIISVDEGRELIWRCVGGHDPWKDSTFRFQIGSLDDDRARLRFWQEYAIELEDDYYGIYNFNWGYYLESLRLLCVAGTGQPFQAGSAAPQTRLPDEGDDYLTQRESLRQAEIGLMRHREAVAQLRRQLPEGPVMPDYVFQEGPADLGAGDGPDDEVKLSELFTSPDRPLVIYHLMYGKQQTSPCPMCTLWIDGFNGVADHLAQNVDFAVVAAADPSTLRAHARDRGWHNLRLLSAGANTFKYDMGSEDAEGNQDSTVSVFTRDADGSVRHRYTARPRLAEDIPERGIDLLCPVWHVLDLTPQGRGDWYAQLRY